MTPSSASHQAVLWTGRDISTSVEQPRITAAPEPDDLVLVHLARLPPSAAVECRQVDGIVNDSGISHARVRGALRRLEQRWLVRYEEVSPPWSLIPEPGGRRPRPVRAITVTEAGHIEARRAEARIHTCRTTSLEDGWPEDGRLSR